MLGSDPLAALLGAGTHPRSPLAVWKSYLRHLVEVGVGVTVLGPDVVIPPEADDATLAALNALLETYPPGSQMPEPKTGTLKDAGHVDVTQARVYSRLASYWSALGRVVGKALLPELLASGAITPSVGLHVGTSGVVAVTVPDAEALSQWRLWSAETSGDRYEAHSAPTIQMPNLPGGGVYLFRIPEGVAVPAGLSVEVAGCTIDTGDVVVPIPPTRQGGEPVNRLGPARMLPEWLRLQLPAEVDAVAV